MQAQSPAGNDTTEATRLTNILGRRAIEKLYAKRQAPVVFPMGQKWDQLYPFVGRTIGNLPLAYLEFGVYRGRSMQKMAEIFGHEDARFVGFDCFEGLPEDWWKLRKGAFSTAGEAPAVDDSRVSFVKGYFQNTLPGFMSTFRVGKPILVHFDADLYSSTLFLLTTLWHHIPEYHFIFDEFWPDEATAMYDFSQAYPVTFEFLASTARAEDTSRPCQLFGRMKNIAYQP